MGDANPWQDKKTTVDGNFVEIGNPFLPRPSQITIPCPDMARGRREPYARNRSIVREDDIVEVFADGLGIAQIVIFLNETLVESFGGSAPHHEDGERFDLCEGGLAGGLINFDLPRFLLSSF